MKMIFLVDGDNNIGTGLKGIDMLSREDAVLVFYQKSGLALSKIQKLCAGTEADVQYIESVRGGKNSIDFQIITELGVLVGKQEADYAYVISQDKGYAASIDALRARYADAFQEVALRPSIESCLHLAFMRRASTAAELKEGLMREYGQAQGQVLFDHLQALFCPLPCRKRRRRSPQDRPAPAGAAAASGAQKRPRNPRANKRQKPPCLLARRFFHAAALRRVSSNPLVMAVRGATVTRPKEPTTVWTISAATYL